jgi:cell division inhibitor SulA
LGDPTGYASSAAALINGTLAHSLDFDDTHAAASLHSSALYKEGRASKAEVLRLTKKEKSQNSRWMLWADLMKRVFQEDVSCCVRCGGRMELRAVVIRPPATLKVLAGLVRSERGRDPPGEVTGWGSE